MTSLRPVVSSSKKGFNVVGNLCEIHEVTPLDIFPLTRCFPLVLLPEEILIFTQ